MWSLESSGTIIVLSRIPSGAEPIPTKWVLKLKTTGHGRDICAGICYCEYRDVLFSEFVCPFECALDIWPTPLQPTQCTQEHTNGLHMVSHEIKRIHAWSLLSPLSTSNVANYFKNRFLSNCLHSRSNCIRPFLPVVFKKKLPIMIFFNFVYRIFGNISICTYIMTSS